jgi:hypothetical protein
MSSDDDSMDATNSDTFIDDGTTKNDITEKSPSKTSSVSLLSGPLFPTDPKLCLFFRCLFKLPAAVNFDEQ